MEIRALPIEQINAAAYNPRVDLQPGDPEYEKLKASIESFGYVELIVWNERTGNMVGGHQRYKIMVNELGHTELAVSVVDLDDQQEKLLNLAAEFAVPQDEALDLPVTDDDFDIQRALDEIKEPETRRGDYGSLVGIGWCVVTRRILMTYHF
ncbi:transcriptional regulator [Paenibacillus sp. TY11]|uniref:transcriptional regulator n=1 Tax=Paenibacillus sp. TY11 TaxID=3448633 RepID=UPI004039DD6E